MNTFLVLATFLYFLGMAKYLLYLGLRKKILFILATAAIGLGFLAQTAGLVELSKVTGHGPYTNASEYCLFLAWTLFAVFLVAEGIFRIKPLGAFMAPLGFLLMLLAIVFSSGEGPPGEVTKAYWLTMHRTLASVSFGAFGLIFAAGVMYLLQERQLKLKRFDGWYQRLPSLSILDSANRGGVIFAFPIFTIGVVAASFWSMQHYGKVMKIDFSTFVLFVGWAIYGILLLGRLVFGWQGRKAAVLGVIAFGIVVSSLVIHLG